MLHVCQQLASRVQQMYVERNLLLLVTYDSDLPLRTIKFCSLLFCFVVVVHAGCDKQDSLMRGGLCGKRLHPQQSQLLFARHQSSTLQPDNRPESRFLPTPSAFDAPVREGLSKYCHNVWCEKNRMVWLPHGKKYEDMFIRFDRIHECDRRTDGHHVTAQAALMHSIVRQKLAETVSA